MYTSFANARLRYLYKESMNNDIDILGFLDDVL